MKSKMEKLIQDIIKLVHIYNKQNIPIKKKNLVQKNLRFICYFSAGAKVFQEGN